MNDHLKHKKSEVFDGGGHGTFDTGGGDWGKDLGYHIIDTGIEYDVEKEEKKMKKQKEEKLKGEIIDEVFTDYTKRKEKERVKPKEAALEPILEAAEEVKEEVKKEMKDVKEVKSDVPEEIINFSALLNQIFEKKNVGTPQYKELGITGWFIEVIVPSINRYDIEKLMKNRSFGYISMPTPSVDNTFRIFVEEK